MKRSALILLLATLHQSLPGLAAAADDNSPTFPLPAWESLEFLQQAFWVTAESRLQFQDCEEATARWCLQATSSVAENREIMRLALGSTGTLIHRERESTGREQSRLKRWSYAPEGITRTRLEPRGERYEITSKQALPYPPQGRDIADSLMLLVLAEPGAEGKPGRNQMLVQTDFNFFEVTLQAAGTESLAVEFQLDGNRIHGDRAVTLIRVQADPVRPLPDKPDFSLLGLSAPITIVYDNATGLPLQLRGKAPRLGKTTINLVNANRRQDAR